MLFQPFKTVACLAAIATFAGVAHGLPTLQLDIAGGTYDPVTQTVIASGNPFTLYALYNTASGPLTGTYYISAAIVPQTTSPSFGSFAIDGTSYSAGGGMQYGNPPVSAAFPDLPSHGIFPTYYAEIAFSFNPA